MDKPVLRIFFGIAIMPMLRGQNENELLDSIVSTKDSARMAENIAAALHPLTPEEFEWLEHVSKE